MKDLPNKELFQSLLLSWASWFSFRLILVHEIAYAWSNRDLGFWDTQYLERYTLPHSVQRNWAILGQPKGTCSIPFSPQWNEYCKVGLYLTLPSDVFCLPLHPAITQEDYNSTCFADAVPQMGARPCFLSVTSYSPLSPYSAQSFLSQHLPASVLGSGGSKHSGSLRDLAVSVSHNMPQGTSGICSAS